jgi:hypothetical protein
MKAHPASSIWFRGKFGAERPFAPGAAVLFFALVVGGVLAPPEGRAQNSGAIGLSLLVLQDATLTGQGARVAQAEAGSPNFPNWEVTNIQPAAVFNYYGSGGTASLYPNRVGLASSHADQVGAILYGAQGVAPGLAAVDNYEAYYFENSIVAAGASIPAVIINQSFVNSSANPVQQAQSDSYFDDYAWQHNVLFISAAGDGGLVSSPASSYNGIGVAAYGGASSAGPTPDNGRCKPDITAPATATSFSTPQVSGAAAILWQAASRGDGGPGTAALAADPMLVKALLLNGAVKSADWTNSTDSPLDFRYGAGILNVFNSWRQLAAGRLLSGQQESAALVGWDRATIQVSSSGNLTNHYYFQVPSAAGDPAALVATLVWGKHAQSSSINHLNLLLYRMADGGLTASSQSPVDNVQHLYLHGISPGGYDLQVVSQAAAGLLDFAPGEAYALSVSFTTGGLEIQPRASGVQIVWPVYPAGRVVQQAGALGAGMNWTTLSQQASVANGQNVIALGATGSAMFFRLAPP